MRNHIAGLFLIALALPCFAQRNRQRPPVGGPAQPQPTQQPSAEDREAIDQLHQNEIDASIAFDIDKIAALWDDEVVVMPPHSKPLQGPAANRAYLEAQRKTLTNVDILGYDQTWNEVRLMGDYAYEWGVISERLRPVNSDKENDVQYNILRVLKRQPSGIWKIYREIWNDQRPEPAAPAAAKPEEKPHQELKP